MQRIGQYFTSTTYRRFIIHCVRENRCQLTPSNCVMLLPHRDFGDQNMKHPNLAERFSHSNAHARNTRASLYFVLASCAIGYVAWHGVKQRRNEMLVAFCDTKEEGDDEENNPDDAEGDEDDKPKKTHIGFRDRKIIAYEDRIRAYSTPDKIFRYFATIRVVGVEEDNDVFMSPADFVRSITPGVMQPNGLGLDSFRRYDPKVDKLHLDLPKDSVFYCLGDKALISFSDYVFLLTVISTPRRQFEIAFRMFDLNGDGELDADEFNVVQSVVRDTTAIGKRHRDHSVTGSTLSRGINSALTTYFFGENSERKLTVNKFLEFQTDLQNEIMKLEFERYNPVDGRISETDFADILLMYAGFSENKKRKMKKRIKQNFSDDNKKGITFEEYADFSHLLRNISDVDTALTFYHLAGASIDQETLKHVTHSVAGVKLTDHVVNVVFTLFDENNDGHLSNREFISVMKHRLLRGLDRPMDTGLFRLLNALFKCSREQLTFRPDYDLTL